MENPPFHMAFPVASLIETRDFFEGLLGCSIGRTSEKWIDFNFFGHQITAHLKPEEVKGFQSNEVDGDQVPVRHFGVILPWEQWEELADRLQNKGIDFIIKPQVRFKGEVGEQATMFFLDPSGNALEFKAFKDANSIFAS